MGYLNSFGPRIFPSYFSPLLHSFCGHLLCTSADARIAAVELNYDLLLERFRRENEYEFKIEGEPDMFLTPSTQATEGAGGTFPRNTHTHTHTQSLTHPKSL